MELKATYDCRNCMCRFKKKLTVPDSFPESAGLQDSMRYGWHRCLKSEHNIGVSDLVKLEVMEGEDGTNK
jgi:hypothetical protein